MTVMTQDLAEAPPQQEQESKKKKEEEKRLEQEQQKQAEEQRKGKNNHKHKITGAAAHEGAQDGAGDAPEPSLAPLDAASGGGADFDEDGGVGAGSAEPLSLAMAAPAATPACASPGGCGSGVGAASSSGPGGAASSSGHGGASDGGGLQDILRHEALRALRTSAKPDTYYSITVSWLRESQCLLPLRFVLYPQPPGASPDYSFLDATGTQLFFRVVRPNPSNMHMDSVDRSSCRFVFEDVAVALHQMTSHDAVNRTVKVCVTSLPGLWVFRGVDYSDTRVRAWRSKSEVTVTVDQGLNLQAEASELNRVAKLFHDYRALDGGLGVLNLEGCDEATLCVTRIFEDAGICARRADNRSLQLTQYGLGRLKIADTLCESHSLFDVGKDLPPSDRSTLALIKAAEEAGWEFQTVTKDSDAPPYKLRSTPASPRKAFLRNGTREVNKSYLHVLLRVGAMEFDKLLLENEVNEIYHLMPGHYYEDLLGKNAGFSKRRSAFHADAGASAAAAKRARRTEAAGAALEVASATAAPLKLAKKKLRKEQSVRWGCVTFTHASEKKADAWEVVCPRLSHATRTKTGKLSRCRHTLGWAKHGGKEKAMHLLKAWIVAGMGASVLSKRQHRLLFNTLSADDLPDLVVLEGQKPAEDRPQTDDEGAVGVKPCKGKAKAKAKAKGKAAAAASGSSGAGSAGSASAQSSSSGSASSSSSSSSSSE